MSLSLITKFGKPLAATRRGVGSYDLQGRFQAGVNSTINFIGSVQPLSSRDRELLPEGTRLKETFKIYTTTKLQPNRGPNTRGDIVTINGEQFEVIGVQDMVTHNSPSNVIRFYRATVERLEESL